MSTAFHPQTDGQTEKANQTLEAMLRAFIDQRQTNWDLLLSAAEFAYNNSTNASTGHSPFFLNYGFHPRVPASLLEPVNCSSPSVFDFLKSQRLALITAKENIQLAQQRQAKNADTRRRDHDFQVGDQVLLNAENIVIAADRSRRSQKLLPRFIGPYTIVEQHSPVTFRVELPPTMKIHDVFHVDRFRHYQPSPEALGQRAPAKPEPEIIDGEEEYEAEEILEDKQRNNRREYLILWKGYPREDATWEPESNLTNCKDLLREYKRKRKSKT